MQKIYSSKLEIFRMIIAFLGLNIKRISCFVEKMFLLTEININIAFEIFFLTLSSTQIKFNNQKLK